MKQKVLVLGATGFLGRNIAKRLAEHPGYDVTCVVHEKLPWRHINVKWLHADLCDPENVDAVMQDKDIVIQAAAVTSGCQDTFGKPWIHVTDNAVMNAYIFRSAFEHKVKQVVYFSCSTMYSGGHVNEMAEVFPHPRYFGMVNTKLYNEKMCAFYAGLGETKFTVIRGSNFYGPYDKFDLERTHVFGATMTKVAQADKDIIVWGNGTEARDLLYIDDLVSFVQCAIERQKNSYELFNCGSGTATPINELVAKIIEASGKKINITYDTSKPTIDMSVSLDCSYAQEQIGWHPITMLEQGIHKTWKWFQENK
jgi:nucleoside-diphosphate-sugar epimerase